MNKILLSGLAGLAVINAAVAVPSPEDREKRCKQNPDKWIWVSRSKQCIEINPCRADDSSIRDIYCSLPILPKMHSKRMLVLDRYAEKVLNTTVSNLKILPSGCYAIETANGDYRAGDWREDEIPAEFDCLSWIYVAFQAYGYNATLNKDETSRLRDEYPLYYSVSHTGSLTECSDINDFASLLSDEQTVYWNEGTGECGITCNSAKLFDNGARFESYK